MPRQPTGKPRGRPKGSGDLGESLRMTVRIPLALYERLTAFAEGRSYTRGAPQLAICVREALEAYLANIGQTKNIPPTDNRISGQTEKQISRQTRNVQKRTADNSGQTEKSAPVYDTSKYVLGKLCPRGRHGWAGVTCAF